MRRLAKLVGASIGALALAALLMALIAATVEIRIPLDSQRERIAHALAEALGSPVAISGPLNLYTGPRAGFDAGRVRIGAGGADHTPAAQVDRLELRLDPAALLQRDLHIVDAAAFDLHVCIDRAVMKAPGAARTEREQPGWRLVAIEHLQVQRLRINTTSDCTVDPGTLAIAQLDLRAPHDAALHLSARGRFERKDASIELTGPSPAALLGKVDAAQPFELAVRYAGATMAVHGEVDLRQQSGRADVDLEAGEVARLLRPLAPMTHDLGPMKLRAHVDVTASAVRLQVHEATLTPVRLNAAADVDWAGPRPSFALRAQTDRLDAAALRDWLAGAKHPAPRDAARPAGEFARRVAAALQATIGRVTIDVGQFDAGPVALSDMALDGKWDGGTAQGTVKALWEASPVDGTWSADLRREPFEFAAAVKARRLRVPARFAAKGHFDAVEARLDARGVPGMESPAELRATVGAQAARLEVPIGRGDPMVLVLGRARAQWRERDTAIVEASGSVAGEKFQLRVEGADATALWQQRPWTFSATGESGLLRSKAQGTLALLAGQVEARFDIDAHAERLGSLARGHAALAALPLAAQAGVSVGQRGWSADLSRLRLGQTLGRATAQGSLQGSAQPLRAELRFDTLDVAELLGSGARTAPDDMVLPQRLVLPAADIEIRAARVRLPGTAIENLIASGSIRDGRLDRASYTFGFDGANVEGTLAADLSGDAATLSATAKAGGLTERHFGPALANKGFRVSAGDVTLAAALTGNRVRDLLANARAQFEMRQASVGADGAADTSARTATIRSARLSAAPGQDVSGELEGDWQGIPISLKAHGAPLADLLTRTDTPIHVDARVADIDIGVDSRVPGSTPWNIRVRAPTLDRLDRFAPVDLPSTGPFALDLALSGLGSARPSADFAMTLGRSELEGRLSKQSAGDRARWQADLRSAHLRLEDLGSAAWVQDDAQAAQSAERTASPQSAARPVASRAHAQFISDEMTGALQRFDARAHLVVAKVSSGVNEFGRIEADAVLESGQFRLGPVDVAGSIGTFALMAKADLALAEAPFDIDLALQQFDYGRLVKTIRPDLGSAGTLNLHLKLAGRGQAAEPLATLNGGVGLIVFPESAPGLKVLELWGGGLLRKLETSIDPRQETRVNCGVATFGVDHGVLRSQALMLDTPNVRIAGELELDLAPRTLKGLIMPKAKRAQLVSLEVPISIGGTLDKPVIAPASGAVALATARSFLLAYRYLYDVARSATLVADGRPDCVAAYDQLIR